MISDESNATRPVSRGVAGVFPSQSLTAAIDDGWVTVDDGEVPSSSIQPASIDLRLSDRAFRLRCSFLPDDFAVADRMRPLVIDELDLSAGAVLEPNRPYLIPLREGLALPDHVRAKANPKSSTGRLDVFTRVITDGSDRFDEVTAGYRGGLYLEVVPLSFAILVKADQALNQLRLIAGQAALGGDDLAQLHQEDPILFRCGRPVAGHELAGDGIFLSLDLHGDQRRRVGYRAKRHTPRLNFAGVATHDVETYWDRVFAEEGSRIVLDPERFYLLLSEESVRIPPDLAAEMTAFDPTSGELRTHYAGFFDPGFGYSRNGSLAGSRAALEVRAHDVPFMIEHGQRVCKLTFERMLAPPDKLYGADVNSNYQGQTNTLGKHFRRDGTVGPSRNRSGEKSVGDQLGLFSS